MKVKIEIEVDMDSGDYEMRFRNISHPGQPIDAGPVMEVIRRAFEQVETKAAVGDAER